MSHSRSCGCREYFQLSRRQFFGVSGAAIAAVSAPAWLPRVAYAGGGGLRDDRDILIQIYLRGGVDGLSLCVPHFEDSYYSLRPTINIPRPDSGDPNAAIDLDGKFGLPQGMSSLVDAYDAGHLLFVHATGLVDNQRSHFDSQHWMEMGKAMDPGVNTGWLGRHLLSTDPVDPNGVVRAIGISGGLQEVLVGGPKSLPIGDMANYNIGGDYYTINQRMRTLSKMASGTVDPLKTNASNALQTINLLDAIDFEGYVPYGDAKYPDTYFGYSLKSSAALIKAGVGVEAIAVDIGGWDTHATQQPRDGYMFYLMQELAQTLAAFHADVIGGGVSNITVMCMSEFGRNIAENGSFGTDHGHGNVMMLMGPGIAGGQVLTKWPGMEPEQQYQGQDLAITIDHRDVIAEVIKNRLGNDDLSYIFPGYSPVFQGVTK